MLDLTPQERRAVLFLFILVFIGLFLSYFGKINPHVDKIPSVPIALVKFNLNKVTLEQLSNSRCISVKLAKQILEYRSASGEFCSLEDLKKVKGIGQHRYEKLKELFCL